MILVDSSVWIEANRKPASDLATTLQALLQDAEVALALPVRIEFLGAASKEQRPKLRRLLNALPLAVPTDETWDLVETWRARGHDAGYTFAIADLLIAALTYEVTGLVWSLDRDFVAMEKLGFVRCY